jgi:hypothetical protein
MSNGLKAMLDRIALRLAQAGRKDTGPRRLGVIQGERVDLEDEDVDFDDVDPEATIRAMKSLTDEEKEIFIDHLRAIQAKVAAEQRIKRFTREEFADELEARGSLLCDCDNPEGSPPTRHGRRLDHHCDCAAVQASAIVRRGESVTRHGRECGCLVADNSVSEALGIVRLPHDRSDT